MKYYDNKDYLNRKYIVCIDHNCQTPLLRSCTPEEFIELTRRSRKNHPVQSFEITDAYEVRTNGDNKIVMTRIPLETLDDYVINLEWQLKEEEVSLKTR